ncbi:MAG: type II toxin-antitoxin system RelB/DinJ family antitoxin [Bifidobacterium sp.]|nr:type II toxin-antitoxin system RelB/DinJ family antitoxin [Bifidobacterium sp.]
MSMVMVTARVDSDRKAAAERVLRDNGRTYSEIIRDLTDYLADTGELPEFEKHTLRLIDEAEKKKRKAELLAFANRPMPPILDHRSDEELLDEALMERFGR